MGKRGKLSGRDLRAQIDTQRIYNSLTSDPHCSLKLRCTSESVKKQPKKISFVENMSRYTKFAAFESSLDPTKLQPKAFNTNKLIINKEQAHFHHVMNQEVKCDKRMPQRHLRAKTDQRQLWVLICSSKPITDWFWWTGEEDAAGHVSCCQNQRQLPLQPGSTGEN